MKFSVTTLAVIVSLAFATPAVDNDAEDLVYTRDADLPMSDLIFEGQITADGPVVELEGTAESIMEQIYAINPYYDGESSPNETEVEAELGSRSLEARRDGKIDCKPGKNIGNHRGCTEGYKYLKGMGNKMCGAKAKSCSRVSCAWGCGISLCNRSNKVKKVKCSSIAKDAEYIWGQCYNGNGASGHLKFKNHYIQLRKNNC